MIEAFTSWYSFYFGNTESKVVFGLMFFLGIGFGWFFRTGNVFLMLAGALLFFPILEFLTWANHWFFSVPFFVGFLVHTARPLREKMNL